MYIELCVGVSKQKKVFYIRHKAQVFYFGQLFYLNRESFEILTRIDVTVTTTLL